MIIKSPKEMFDLGAEISQQNKKILLYGDLGAGKTHFAKGFAEKIGIDSSNVTSPTYTYVNIYDNKFLHIDMYRLENIEELIEKGILDIINNFEYVCIERPKWETMYTNNEYKKIHINKTDVETREITME